MIRNKTTVFGEANDPNTVLAKEELLDNKYVVGAGNRGVKPYDAGKKKLMITDMYGNVGSVSYDVANKCVGTDMYGNIVLKDLPTGGNIYRFGGADNRIVMTGFGFGLMTNNENAGIDEGTGRFTQSGNTTYSIYGTKAPSNLQIGFENSLVLKQDTKCNICVHVDMEDIKLRELKIGGRANSLGFISNPVLLNANNSACNITMTLPAGEYNTISMVCEDPDINFENKIVTVSVMIVY